MQQQLIIICIIIIMSVSVNVSVSVTEDITANKNKISNDGERRFFAMISDETANVNTEMMRNENWTNVPVFEIFYFLLFFSK
jgi:hypothetical protein